MAEIFGQAFWPGVAGFVSCTYTCSQGISPGIASLEIPEQDVSKILPFGSLVITDGSFAVRLNRCRIVDIAFRGGGGGGRTIVLSIADRRWMWQFGYISGNWNAIDPYPDADLLPSGEFVAQGGPYAPGTYRLAVNLMQDCFAAMNETAAAAIAPAPAVPVAVTWENENPAAALQMVCDAVGYRVAYQPIRDRVLVSPSGVGKTLTGLFPIITDSASVNLPTRPATIKLVGGNTVYHDYLYLEPVGLEKNGQIKHIDDLSYAPALPGGGVNRLDNRWEACNPHTMPDVIGGLGLSEAEAKEMAKRHVWRTFRVKMTDVETGNAGPNVAGYGRVNDRKQIVLGTQVYETSKNAAGQYETESPWVIGSVYIPTGDYGVPFALTMAGSNTNHTDGIRLPMKPVVDSARGLVTFDRQMLIRDTTRGIFQRPELYLYTSMQIRSTVGQIPSRFEWGGTLPGVVEMGCPPEVIRHPELGAVFRAVRRSRDKALVVVANNLDDIIPPAEFFLNAANAKYSADVATDRTYAGIVPIEPDGAIQQVTWSVGGGSPATTRASRNTEHSTYLPSYPERRRNETYRMLAARLNGSASSVPAKSMNPPPPGFSDAEIAASLE